MVRLPTASALSEGRKATSANPPCPPKSTCGAPAISKRWPLSVSYPRILPAFSVTTRICVPGTKAAAHGMSNTPRSSTAIAASPLSTSPVAPQLASMSGNRDRLNADLVKLGMAVATPENDKSIYPVMIGVDEAGRGPLAGPVVAAAVTLCEGYPQNLDDSKRISAKRRAVLDEAIRATCLWGVGIADFGEIDSINIFAAAMLAKTRAVANLCSKTDRVPEIVLIDGNMTPAGRCNGWRWPARAIVGGDASEPAISAASIVA